MLEKADVVVMDLATFSEKNRGCVYELRQLIDQKPLQRVILLIDEETDTRCLCDVLREAWEGMSDESPNYGTTQPIRLFHMGGETERRPDERVQEWRRRVMVGLEKERFVALLRDAARSEQEMESPLQVHWAR